MSISEQEQARLKRFSARSILLLALIVAGASGVAYGIAYGLNNTLAAANNTSEYQTYLDWGGRHRGPFGPGYYNTSSFRAISTVDGVSVTGFNVVSNNQVSVSLSYGGSDTTPAITIVGMAPGLSGSNTLAAGWSSPTTVTVSLTGNGTLSTTWHSAVLIVPYTGA